MGYGQDYNYCEGPYYKDEDSPYLTMDFTATPTEDTWSSVVQFIEIRPQSLAE